jgi:hypothetical protein
VEVGKWNKKVRNWEGVMVRRCEGEKRPRNWEAGKLVAESRRFSVSLEDSMGKG